MAREILHATLTVSDNALMGGDPVPEQYEQPKGFAALLGIDDPLSMDAERIFHALAENGTVQMPLQKTFWAVRFGALVDQIRHTVGDQLRASAQRSVERKGSRKTPPDPTVSASRSGRGKRLHWFAI
jgi:hypothetical protein